MTVTLRMIKFAIGLADSKCFYKLSIQEVQNRVTGAIDLFLTGYLLGENDEKTYEFIIPNMPKWLLKIWPLGKTKNIVNARIVYPQLTSRLPKNLKCERKLNIDCYSENIE